MTLTKREVLCVLYLSYLDEPSQSNDDLLDRGFLWHLSYLSPNTGDGVSPGTN